MEERAPKRRMTRAETKARTRALLLESAREVFARKGFAAASVDEIADAAGYSTGALYSNFAGKEELFTELVADGAAHRVAAAQHTVADAASREDPLRAMSRLLGDVADVDPGAAALQTEFRLQAMRSPELRGKLAEQVGATRAAVRGLIEQWREATDPDGAREDRVPLPDGIEVAVLALFQGMVDQRRLDPETVPEELYARALRWLFAGVRAERASVAQHDRAGGPAG